MNWFTTHCRWIPACQVTFVMAYILGSASAQTNTVFRIEGADDALRRQTLEVLGTAHREMQIASGAALGDTIRVVYVPADQSFDSVIGGRFPDWGVAAAVDFENLIAVRSPKDHPLGRDLTSILRHELAHLHLSHMVRHRLVPRWMQEGYAQHFGHQWKFGDDWTVSRAVLAGNTLPLRDIDGVNSFRSASAQLAYAQSYLALGYFLDTYGWTGFRIFTDQTALGVNWDDAFRESIGTDYAGFQKEYADYLRSRYNWASFLGDTAVLWVAFVCAFVIFYFINRRRTRRRLEELRREDEWEDQLFGYDTHWSVSGDRPTFTGRVQICLSR